MNEETSKDHKDELLLMKKKVLLSKSKILYDRQVTPESLASEWTIHHSEWSADGEWLTGSNRGNHPGMAILNQDFPGNVLVERRQQENLGGMKEDGAEPMMSVEELAEVAVHMATLPLHVNFLEAIVLPTTQTYIGRG